MQQCIDLVSEKYKVDSFFYYSKSKHAKPGYGTNEKNVTGNLYAELDAIADWRKVLSNFYIQTTSIVCPDTGLHFASVEHFHQAAKFKHHNALYKTFSIEGGNYPTGDAAKTAGGKSGKGRPVHLKNVSAVFGAHTANAANIAMAQKFTRDELSKRVLLNTGDALLYHSMGRGNPVTLQVELMKIRELIN